MKCIIFLNRNKIWKKIVKFWLNLHWLEKSADTNAQQIPVSDFVFVVEFECTGQSRTLRQSGH